MKNLPFHTKSRVILVSLILLSGIVLARPAEAYRAFFYFQPSEGIYREGEVFPVNFFVSTNETAINAAQGKIIFNPEKMKVVEISKTGSIFNLWFQEPVFSNQKGEISFGGGLPSPGYSGADGKIIGVLFQAKTKGEAEIRISNGIITANDPWGTDIYSPDQEGSFAILQSDASLESNAIGTPLESFNKAEKDAENSEGTIPAPRITVCPKTINPIEELLYIGGSAPPESKIVILLEKEGVPVKNWSANSNEEGDWFLTEEVMVKSGTYKITAETENEAGLKSSPSDPCIVKIALGTISVGSWIIHYETLNYLLLAALSFVLILSLFFFYKSQKTRQLIRKETADLKEKFLKEYRELQIAVEHARKAKEGNRKEAEEELLKELSDIERVFIEELKDIEEIK